MLSGGRGRKFTPRSEATTDARSAVRRTERRSRESIFTIGYKTLAEKTGKNPQSLMRMLGPAGNPTAENLFSVIKQLKEQEGLEFDIRARQAITH